MIVTICGRRCAFPLDQVSEIVRAASVAPLSDAPDVVMGVLNLRGQPVVVIDGRTCVGAAPEPMQLSDRLVVVRGSDPLQAVRVEGAFDVVDVVGDELTADLPVPGSATSKAVALTSDGVLVVHDLAAFVTARDAALIRAALDASPGAAP